MLYLNLWIVGVICTIVSAIMFRIDNRIVNIISYMIAGIGMVLGYGIPLGLEIGYYIGLQKIGACIFFAIVLILLEWLSIWLFYDIIAQIDFDGIFIILIAIGICATIGFAIPGYKSGQEQFEYNKNIEVMEPSAGVAWSHEYELLSFNNVPVQKISGELSGEMNNNIFYGEGEISGSITTTDEIAYWFINKEGKGQYHTISPSDCYIVPVEDNITPYVKVLTYRETQKTIDHNIEEEKVEVLSEWREYEFYIPKSLIK